MHRKFIKYRNVKLSGEIVFSIWRLMARCTFTFTDYTLSFVELGGESVITWGDAKVSFTLWWLYSASCMLVLDLSLVLAFITIMFGLIFSLTHSVVCCVCSHYHVWLSLSSHSCLHSSSSSSCLIVLVLFVHALTLTLLYYINKSSILIVYHYHDLNTCILTLEDKQKDLFEV